MIKKIQISGIFAMLTVLFGIIGLQIISNYFGLKLNNIKITFLFLFFINYIYYYILLLYDTNVIVDQKFQEKNFDFFKIVKKGRYEVDGEKVRDKDAEKVYKAYKNLERTRKGLRMDKKEETMVGSYLGWAGCSLEPITKFAGFNWKINIGLISSFAAKENVVGVFGSIYQSEEGETLEKYSNSYKDYMKKVPRYFLFFKKGEKVTDKNKKNKQGFLRLLEIAGQKKWKLFISGFLSIISAVLSLAPFIIIYLVMVKLLDTSFGPKDYGYIWKLAWIAVGAIIGRFLILFISGMFSHIAAFDILYGLRKNLAKHMGGLSMGYFTEKSSGEIKKVLSEDVEQIELFVAHHIPDMVAGVALPLLTISYLFITDWRMALIALIPLPIALLLQIAMMGGSEYKNLMKGYHDSLEKMNGTIIEYIRGMPVIKIFNQTVISFSRFKDSVYGYRDYTNAWNKKGTPSWAAFTVIVSSSLFFLLPFGIWFYIKGTIELPVLFLCLMLGAGYMVPLIKLSMMGGYLRQINEGVKRIDKIFSESEMPDAVVPEILKNNTIEFKNVNFSYKEKTVLHDISFEIKEGTVTALVGPSGAGKTTVAHLIPRMWDIDDGEILIGGVNIKDISRDKLMDRIGFVFQDIFMFSDTVYENIRMGTENVQEEDIIRAAKVAQCHEFIEELPTGYNTIIGEAGTIHLSGGERQRIAMARIILKNAPIIVLDEAIAYADAENEVKIQSAFAEIMKGKTVIVIAHRLSTITDADQIIVIDEGKIANKGTHTELLKSGNLYKRMWDTHISAREWAFNLSGGKK